MDLGALIGSQMGQAAQGQVGQRLGLSPEMTRMAAAALAPALAGNNHISVDLVTSKLKPQVNRVLHIITSVIGLVFCLILTVASADMVLVSYEINSLSTSTLRIPLYIPQACIPIGSALIVLEFIRQILADLTRQSAQEGK